MGSPGAHAPNPQLRKLAQRTLVGGVGTTIITLVYDSTMIEGFLKSSTNRLQEPFRVEYSERRGSLVVLAMLYLRQYETFATARNRFEN